MPCDKDGHYHTCCPCEETTNEYIRNLNVSRSLQTRKDHVSALRIRLESCLTEVDHWSGSFDLGDEIIARFLEARVTVREAVLLVGEAEGLMPEEER